MEFDDLKKKKVSHALFSSFYNQQPTTLKKKKKLHTITEEDWTGNCEPVFNPDFLLCPWANHQNLSLSFLICQSSKLNEIVHCVQPRVTNTRTELPSRGGKKNNFKNFREAPRCDEWDNHFYQLKAFTVASVDSPWAAPSVLTSGLTNM